MKGLVISRKWATWESEYNIWNSFYYVIFDPKFIIWNNNFMVREMTPMYILPSNLSIRGPLRREFYVIKPRQFFAGDKIWNILAICTSFYIISIAF